MSNTPCLYKKLPDGNGFVKYNPARDEYSLVDARDVPPLHVVGQRVRLSATEQRGDSSALFRRAACLAMLDLAAEARTTGDVTDAIPEMLALANLGDDPDAQRALGIAAIAPRPLRSGEAQQALQPVSVQDVFRTGATPTPETLLELIGVLVRMSLAQVRTVRAQLEVAWGGANLRRGGIIEKLTTWAKKPVASTPKSDVGIPTSAPVRMSHTSAPGKRKTYRRL